MTDVTFTAKAAFDRELFWKGGDSVRFLVASLKARRKGDRRSADPPPLNIALVIDASGSMSGGKLEAAKEAALGLAKRLTKRDRLTVVSFASDIIVHLDAVRVTKDNTAKIRKEITRLETRGMTNLSGGWFAGAECAARIAEEDPRMTPRIIILSDGHANEGITEPAELREHAGELKSRGVLTSTLGIGDGYDEQLLRGIAESGGGRLHDAELTGEISAVLLGEVDEITGTAVDNAEIRLSIPPNVRVSVLGRTNSEIRDGCIVVPIGPVQNKVKRTAVFKIKCPESRKNNRLAFEAAASGRAIDDQSVLKTTHADVSLVAAGREANKSQPRNTKIAAIVARNWHADVAAKAARMNRDGEFDDAKNYIKRELKYLRRYVKGLDGGKKMIRELELLAGRVDAELSPRLHKEIMLSSVLRSDCRSDLREHYSAKRSWSDRLELGD